MQIKFVFSLPVSMSKTWTQRFLILRMAAKPSASSLPALKYINLTFLLVLCHLRKRRYLSSPKCVCMAHSAGSAPDAFYVCCSQITNWSHIYFYTPWFLCSLYLGSPLTAITICWLDGRVIRLQVLVAGNGLASPWRAQENRLLQYSFLIHHFHVHWHVQSDRFPWKLWKLDQQ